jgi:iron complex transport system substrate-binding protein
MSYPVSYPLWGWLLAAVMALPAVSVSRVSAEPGAGEGLFRAVDARGVAVDLGRQPVRLVSLAPSNTELLFALGVGPRIVGVTEYCDFPAAAGAIAKVASYSDLSVERIMAVNPDLVLAARGNDLEGLKSLQQLGVPAVALDIQTIPALLSAVGRMGRLLGVTAAADSLARELSRRVAIVSASIPDIPSAHRPRVMWGYWGDPIFTAGHGSLIDHLIREAGGINVAGETSVRWPQVSLESIVDWAPQVLVTTHLPADFSAMSSEIEKLRALDGWSSIPAVQNGHVYHIEANLLTRSGPRMVDGLERLAAILKTID